MKYVFGIDVGGTTVKMGLLDENGNIVDKWEINTDKSQNGSNILPDVAKAMEKKMNEHNISKEDVIGAGIGVPGPVDGNGIIHNAVNLGWGTFNVDNKLAELTGMKCRTGNDANVAALGEMWKGGGRGFSSIIMVTLGTGVGGGIIIDGKILSGACGAGGEIGHVHIKDGETVPCGCGNFGCLEQYTSATGIARTAEKMLKEWKGSTILSTSDCSAKAVFDGAKKGDELCLEIVDSFADCLGKGLSIFASVVNPEAFVIGGGVSKAGDILINKVHESFNKYVFKGAADTKIVLATLGNDAGMYGAAKLVMD